MSLISCSMELERFSLSVISRTILDTVGGGGILGRGWHRGLLCLCMVRAVSEK